MNEANRRALRVTAYDVTDRLWAMFWKSLTALCVTIAIVIGILTGIKVAQSLPDSSRASRRLRASHPNRRNRTMTHSEAVAIARSGEGAISGRVVQADR